MRRGQRWVGWFLGEDSRFATGFWTLRKVGTLDLGKCASRSKVPGVVSDARVETLMKSKVLWGYRWATKRVQSSVGFWESSWCIRASHVRICSRGVGRRLVEGKCR